MDTGMGTNAYSVIELKMIETILSNKADERRKMFEEAAGVNKYKLRRRLSLKKLDEVKSDLVRVNDIVAEIEKNVRSLQRQAKKADDDHNMQGAVKRLEATVLLFAIDLSAEFAMLFHHLEGARQPEKRMQSSDKQRAHQQYRHEPEGVEENRILGAIVVRGVSKVACKLAV